MTPLQIALLDLQLYLHPKGIKAKELAKILKIEKKEINRHLYNNQSQYHRDGNYKWTITKPAAVSDPVLDKANNKNNAKVFTVKEFESLASWKFGKSQGTSAGVYSAKCGNKIEYDSKAELEMLEYIDANDLAECMGGQSLCITYNTHFSSGKLYFPDIALLTKEGHIVLIEVKSQTAMDNHMTMEKYHALKSYCELHGYEYMMVDSQHGFSTFEEIRDMDVHPGLFDDFNSMAEDIVDDPSIVYHFEKQDVDEWFELYGEGQVKKDFYLGVHAMVMYFGWYNRYKNGFMVDSSPHISV